MDSTTPTIQPLPLTELQPKDLALHVVSQRTGRCVMRGWEGTQWGPAFLPPDLWEDPLETWLELSSVGTGIDLLLARRIFRHFEGYRYLGYGLNVFDLPDLYYRPIPRPPEERPAYFL